MINRRRFVALAGSGAMVGLAGCSNNGGGGDGGGGSTPTEAPPEVETSEGPAEFAVYGASWAESEAVTVDGDGNVELLIGNRGGEAGTFSGELVAESLDSSSADALTGGVSSVEGEVGSGETVTVTSETITPRFAGRYEATLADGMERLDIADGADVELQVAPHRGSGSDKLALGENLRLSVEQLQFEQGLHRDIQVASAFSSKDRVALMSTLSDQTFVVVYAAVENTGNRSATVGQDMFQLAGESAISASGVHDVENDPLMGANVNPGSRVRGWLLFRVSQDAVAEAELKAYRDSVTAAADAVWELGIEKRGFAKLELEEVDIPETYKDSKEIEEFNFTIRNTGEATGTFRGETQWRDSEGDGDWEEYMPNNEELEARIPPGETATVTTATEYDAAPTDYRFNPFGATFTVRPE